MNGVGLTTVGRLLGHRQRETTAIYAHLDDGALRDAAAQAAAVIARAMGYRAEAPPLPDEAKNPDTLPAAPVCPILDGPSVPEDERPPLLVGKVKPEPRADVQSDGEAGPPSGRPALDWL